MTCSAQTAAIHSPRQRAPRKMLVSCDTSSAEMSSDVFDQSGPRGRRCERSRRGGAVGWRAGATVGGFAESCFAASGGE